MWFSYTHLQRKRMGMSSSKVEKNNNFSRRTKHDKCGVSKQQNKYYYNSISSFGNSGNCGLFGGISSRYRSWNSNYNSMSQSYSF